MANKNISKREGLELMAKKPTRGLFEQVFLNTEQNMSDITVGNNEKEEFDPTTPMINKPVPFPNDNVISNPVVEESLISKMAQVFDGEKCSELAVILGMLEGMNIYYQTLHWKVNGKSFYGDHLMFQRIYETFPEAIDAVAEKLVAFSGTPRIVDHKKIIKAIDVFLDHVNQKLALEAEDNGPHIDDIGYSYSKNGKFVLTLFIETTEKLLAELESKGEASKGLDNLIAGILDKQEENLFLLKQRVLAGF